VTDDNPDLVAALLEIERHVGASGWDRPPQLFALADSADLAEREPALARQLGVDPERSPITPVEQDTMPDGPLDEALARMEWPPAVTGCALVHEVVTLPPGAEEQVSTAADAASHPERREIRLAVAVLRDGSRAAAARIRPPGDGPEEPGELVVSPDLAPALADALLATLRP
jgi:hypothetical protein